MAGISFHRTNARYNVAEVISGELRVPNTERTMGELS